MCRNTIFCCFMHLICSNLNFKWLSVWSDQCRMQWLVMIWFRHRNIIFKTSRNRLIHLVNDSKSRITLLLCIYNNSYRKQIINLLQCLILIYHLSVNTEQMLDTSVDRCLDLGLIEMFFDIFHDILDKCFLLHTQMIKFVIQFLVSFRLQIL